jgi:hypothetical protein
MIWFLSISRSTRKGTAREAILGPLAPRAPLFTHDLSSNRLES